MTIVYRLYTPLDQQRSLWPTSYSDWNVDPVTEWQVSLGGIMLGKNSEWCLTSVEGVGLPDIRTTDSDESFLHGIVALGDFAGGRTVTIGAAGKFDTGAEAWTALRALAGVWQAVVWEQPLRLRMTGDDSLMLIGHPRKLEADTSGIHLGVVSVTLEFVATDPRFYNANISSYQAPVTATPSGGLCFTTAPDNTVCFTTAPDNTVCIPQTSNGQFTVVNNGNARTAPVITLVGNATNVVVTNVTTGDAWNWTGTTGSATAVLKADHLARIISLDGVEFYSALTASSEFFWLDPGPTQLNLTVAGGSGLVQIRFRDAWF